ncbi:MAG: hypothetical protein FWC73_14555 [Defluviitaleaceae bacterium]|nr:hypothetical protein [Defluviitaleaceae bacterium]
MKDTTSSVWGKTANKKNYPTLMGDITTDVLIIGGGIQPPKKGMHL